MTKYELSVDTIIPLSILLMKADASLEAGLSVFVKVINASTGATVLASTAMTEIATGHYRYNWTHGLNAKTSLMAVYNIGSANSSDADTEFILIDDTVSRNDESDGRAV